jgi:hypothetical protein
VAASGTRAAGERMRRIGVLLSTAADDPESSARTASFLQGLQQLGWIEGRNIRIDYRWGGGDANTIRKYAAELAPGRHPGQWLRCGADAAGDAHGTDCVRDHS